MTDARRAVVTGASGCVGGAIAEHLRSKGWEVLAPSHQEMPVEDCSIVQRYLFDIGKIDLLINAHGVNGFIGPIRASNPNCWMIPLQTNLRGTYNTCRFAEFREEASVINIAGGGGMLDAMPKMAGYGCSKAAIVSFTNTLAEESRYLRANCIFPGIQDSKIHDEIVRLGELAEPQYSKVMQMKKSGGVPIENTLQIVNYLTRADATETGMTFYARRWTGITA